MNCQKSVTPKIALAPANARLSEAGSSRSAATSSMPASLRGLLLALSGSRVIPRIFQPDSFWKTFATEPPFNEVSKSSQVVMFIVRIKGGVLRMSFSATEEHLPGCR